MAAGDGVTSAGAASTSANILLRRVVGKRRLAQYRPVECEPGELGLRLNPRTSVLEVRVGSLTFEDHELFAAEDWLAAAVKREHAALVSRVRAGAQEMAGQRLIALVPEVAESPEAADRAWEGPPVDGIGNGSGGGRSSNVDRPEATRDGDDDTSSRGEGSRDEGGSRSMAMVVDGDDPTIEWCWSSDSALAVLRRATDALEAANERWGEWLGRSRALTRVYARWRALCVVRRGPAGARTALLLQLQRVSRPSMDSGGDGGSMDDVGG